VTTEPSCAHALQLQRAALERAAWAFTIPAVLLVDGTAIDAARYIERTLEGRGDLDATWMPSVTLPGCEPVRRALGKPSAKPNLPEWTA
jgi:hypothetical protein